MPETSSMDRTNLLQILDGIDCIDRDGDTFTVHGGSELSIVLCKNGASYAIAEITSIHMMDVFFAASHSSRKETFASPDDVFAITVSRGDEESAKTGF